MFFFEIILMAALVGAVYMLFVIMNFKEEMEEEAISSYECGFDPISLARSFFSQRFFLISILFIIFDVEISLMLPTPFIGWSLLGMVMFLLFVFILLLGTLYEYYCGSLKWLN